MNIEKYNKCAFKRKFIISKPVQWAPVGGFIQQSQVSPNTPRSPQHPNHLVTILIWRPIWIWLPNRNFWPFSILWAKKIYTKTLDLYFKITSTAL